MANEEKNRLLKYVYDVFGKIVESKRHRLKQKKHLLLRAQELKERIENTENLNNLTQEL